MIVLLFLSTRIAALATESLGSFCACCWASADEFFFAFDFAAALALAAAVVDIFLSIGNDPGCLLEPYVEMTIKRSSCRFEHSNGTIILTVCLSLDKTRDHTSIMHKKAEEK